MSRIVKLVDIVKTHYIYSGINQYVRDAIESYLDENEDVDTIDLAGTRVSPEFNITIRGLYNRIAFINTESEQGIPENHLNELLDSNRRVYDYYRFYDNNIQDINNYKMYDGDTNKYALLPEFSSFAELIPFMKTNEINDEFIYLVTNSKLKTKAAVALLQLLAPSIKVAFKDWELAISFYKYVVEYYIPMLHVKKDFMLRVDDTTITECPVKDGKVIVYGEGVYRLDQINMDKSILWLNADFGKKSWRELPEFEGLKKYSRHALDSTDKLESKFDFLKE